MVMLNVQQVNYLDISIESKSQASDEDAGSMYEGNTSDSYSSAAEDDNDDFVLEGMFTVITTVTMATLLIYRGPQEQEEGG